MISAIFESKTLDDLFECHATSQYTREVLFSGIVRLMSLVVSGIHPSVNAAYKSIGKSSRSFASRIIREAERNGIAY